MARYPGATWVGPSVNSGDGDGRPGESADAMASVRGLVVHIAQGTYAGTISWERNPDANVSSHWIVARDGRLAQMVDTHDRSWCQRAGNGDWLSIECEGKLPQALAAQQMQVIARLLVWIRRTYPAVPLTVTTSPSGRGLGYHSMGGPAWGHIACPGAAIIAQLPGIVTRAKRIMEGEDMDWSDDIAPGSATYSAGGAIYTTLERTGSIANAQLPALTVKVDQLLLAAGDQQTQHAALLAAVQALAAGGSSIDTTAILAAVQAQGEQTRSAILGRLAAAGVVLAGS